MRYLFLLLTNRWHYIVFVLIIAVGVLGFGESVGARELHVGTGQVYSTIQSAIEASKSGDIIYIHSGNYNEYDLRPKSGIDANHPTIISGVAGENRPVIYPQVQTGSRNIIVFDLSAIKYVKLQYLNIGGGGWGEQGTVTIGGDSHSGETSYITIDHCKIYDSNVGGSHNSYNPAQIRINYGGHGSHITISNCEITGPDAAGLKIYAGNPMTPNGPISEDFSYITIEHNYIHDVVHGVAIKWGDAIDRHCVIAYNLIADVSEKAIYVDQAYTYIHDNIVVRSGKACIQMGEDFYGNHCIIEHNSLHTTESGDVMVFPYGSYNMIRYNIFYPTTHISDYGTGNTFTDNYRTNPLWVNVDSNDFHLQQGSGAVGTASDGKDMGANVDLVGIQFGPDTTPPVRTNPQPTGTLSSGTTQTTISLTTDETATCKYSATAGTDYDSMGNTFSSTNSTTHSQIITGLSDGGTYTYYIRCQDEQGNTNTDDYPITFSVAETSLQGDVTGDNIVDINDVQACVNHILGRQNLGSAADVNGDEEVNVLDVQEVVNIVLG